jgi:hypothetical protein
MRTTHQAYDPATGPAQAFPAGTGQGGRSFAAAGQPRRLRILGAACSAAAVAGWLVLGTGPATAAPRLALAAAVADAAACGPGAFTLNAQPGDSQVTLSWCEPSPDPGNPWTLASYSIADGTSPGGESALTSVDSATTSYTVQGLTNGTTYYFRVEAVPETPEPVTSSPSTSTPSSAPIARTLLIPSGIWTNEVTATPQAAISRPGAPSGLRASPGDSQVTLSWTAPEAAGSSPVTGYSIYLGRSPGRESEVPISHAPGTTAVIAHLANGVRYYFVVAADSAAGSGDSSSEASAVPHATPGKTKAGHPGSGRPRQTGSAAPPAHQVWGPFATGGGGILLTVVGILMVRRVRVRSRSRTVREPAVRVKPAAGPPGQVAIRTTDSQPAVTVRIDPDAGARSILVEEVRS